MIKISRHFPLQDLIFLCLQHCHTFPMADGMLSSGGKITVKTQEKTANFGQNISVAFEGK